MLITEVLDCDWTLGPSGWQLSSLHTWLMYLSHGQQSTHNKELWTLFTCSPADLGPPSQLSSALGHWMWSSRELAADVYTHMCIHVYVMCIHCRDSMTLIAHWLNPHNWSTHGIDGHTWQWYIHCLLARWVGCTIIMGQCPIQDSCPRVQRNDAGSTSLVLMMLT